MLKLHIARDGRSPLGRKLYRTRLTSTTNIQSFAYNRLTSRDLRDIIARVAEQAVFTGQGVHYSGLVIVDPRD
jgi:hypothetical protein